MRTGHIIQSLRKQNGLSQEQLADRLYVSRELVSKWETGLRRPDREMTARLAALFGVEETALREPEEQIRSALADCVPEDADLPSEDAARLLNAFLRTLSARDRAVYLRRFYYLEAVSDIAESFGIKNSTVRSVLSRTKNKLRAFIKEETK